MSEQTKNLLGGNYNPDVLECLANLSNDEVFTPPKVVNDMLDMLPEETWSNPNLKFLDPACKTGVFLREIAKRLIVGLADQIPDLQERLDHIFKEQLYGIAITELTALASRRSLYCSKYANGKYAVSKFDNPDGNIRFVPINHTWEGGRCKYCGASKEQYQRDGGLETHAYEFIHTNNPEEIFNMKFDVIIGNPPYQMSDGGGGRGSSASPIYHKFVENSKKLQPKYFSMIIPSRWMTGGKGLESFRDTNIRDQRYSIVHDFEDDQAIFPSNDVGGGIMYFLWELGHSGELDYYFHGKDEVSRSRRFLDTGSNTIIRDYSSAIICNKIKSVRSFDEIVSSQKPFGYRSDITRKHPELFAKAKSDERGVAFYCWDGSPKTMYISKDDIPKRKYLDTWKVFISKTADPPIRFGRPNKDILRKPFLGGPNTACSETYLVIGGECSSDFEAKAILKYIMTKVFRFLVLQKKKTQNVSKDVFGLVPMQDFSEKSDIDWTRSVDEINDALCNKYSLTDDEKTYIDSFVSPMEDK